MPDNFPHKKVGQRSRKLVKSGCNKEFFNSIFTVDTLRAEFVIKFLARSIKREGLLAQLHFYMIEFYMLYFVFVYNFNILLKIGKFNLVFNIYYYYIIKKIKKI